jgi:purine-binding chemotaxis protein CheW
MRSTAVAVANDNRGFEALTFGLQDEIFAIDADNVLEILDVIPVTEVPGARRFVPGLINVRGKVVPLADLRVRFGMDCAEATRDTRIIVMEIDLADEAAMVGILADKVYEVTQIAGDAIESTPPIGMRWRSDFIRGIGKRGDDFIIIPDLKRIFAADQPVAGPK